MTRPKIDGYISWLRRNDHFGMTSCIYDDKSQILLDELFALLEQIAPESPNGVRSCIEMLKAGTYNDVVRENLPPQHRTGTIRRRDFWNVWPDARVDFFKDISPADVAEFIERASAQEENYAAMKDRLQAMTANDFFRFCAMGYAENKYDGCGKTPKEQYVLHADGRDEGLQDIDADSPEAFHAWLHDRDRCGGHPWEVCRGGNSTHVDLRVLEDGRGYFLYLAGAA